MLTSDKLFEFIKTMTNRSVKIDKEGSVVDADPPRLSGEALASAIQHAAFLANVEHNAELHKLALDKQTPAVSGGWGGVAN